MSCQTAVPHASRPHVMPHRTAIVLLPVVFAVACLLLLSLNPAEARSATPTVAPLIAQPSPLLAPEAITLTPSFGAKRSPGTKLDQAQNATLVNMDGDLAVENRVPSNPLAPNSDSPLTWDTSWYPELRQTSSVAWGDVDGDGDLDLLVGNDGYPNQLYRNNGGTLTLDAAWNPITSTTESVAWGDVDGDGDLDLLVGNLYDPNQLYRNHGGTLTLDAAWNPITSTTESVAWGDVDGDGDLDLLVGNWDAPNQLYRNNGGILTLDAAWNPEPRTTTSVAWGDVDGDGDLDLLVGNWGANQLYRNDGGTLTLDTAWNPIPGTTQSVAWGDVDGDGDLDLLVGNAYAPNQLYRNNGGTLTIDPAWNPITSTTWSVVWGDVDGDGDLDLLVGNKDAPNQLYRNNGGTLTLDPAWNPITSGTYSVAWGDVDGDSDLDLLAGNWGAPNQLYRSHGGTLTLDPAWNPITSTTWSVAWGDVNGDGDLDLLMGNGNGPDQLYRNHSGSLTLDTAWNPITLTTKSVAWGDMDGDGDLDLLVGKVGQPNQLYRNTGGTLTLDTAWNPEPRETQSVAWGDVDGDGDLDLLVGNGVYFGPPQPNQLYRNNDGTLTLDATWNPEPRTTTSVAWGDVDGDGDLDLLVGNYNQPNQLYRNHGGSLTLDTAWNPTTNRSRTSSVAWGDMDGDGDLDLLVGNLNDPNQLYRNHGGTLTLDTTWNPEPRVTRSVAWGDVDGDGDLDLLVGNWDAPNQLYRNDGGTLTLDTTWNPELRQTTSVAWGDVDGDGDLDLLVGNYGQPDQLYRNGGRGFSGLPNNAPSPALRQPYTLTAANLYAMSGYLTSQSIPISYTLFDPKGDPVGAIRAYFSPDGGGRWLPAVAANGTLTSNLVTTATYAYKWDTFTSGFFGQSDNVVFRIEAYPSLSSGPNGVPVFQHPYASATTFPFRVRGTQVRVTLAPDASAGVSGTQPISNAIVYDLPAHQTVGATLFADSTGNPFHTDGQGYLQGRGQMGIDDRLMALYPVYSQYRDGSLTFDGVNDHVSVPNPTVPISNTAYTLAAWIKPVSMGSRGIVGWGNFGATNQINAVRLTANGLVNSWGGNDLAVTTNPLTGTWHHVVATFNGVIRTLYLDGAIVGSDTPTGHAVPDSRNFRIGSINNAEYFDGEIGEISVWNVARSQTELQADMVRALNGNEAGLVGYWRFDEGSGDIAHDQTSNHNDGMLSGPTWNGGGEQYAVYHTSAAPNSTGLNMTTVLTPGVQTLVVTSSNSLILFNLDVALEWDARQDTQFLSQLEHDLHRTSELLFDWSNGQAALGKVNVYFDRENWDAADVQIHATNRLRPNATQGGIVPDLLVDPITATGIITYGAGQVNMGSVWNRYGEASGNLGEDWPRALAHEIGHYALFLDDDYLGLDANNHLIPIDTCSGTVMSDPYREDYSEFHPGGASWISGCASTLAAKQTGRWDWQTITTFYPWLKSTANTGPSGLPLEVTTINFVKPVTPTTVLLAPIFNLTQDGARVQPGTSARAYLYQQTDRLIDLGGPTLDQVNARGARVGDRLCVYELNAQRLGCETITAGDEELTLASKPDWQPDILVTPVNSHTFNLNVNVAGLSPAVTVQARLYPIDGAASAAITLARLKSYRVYLPVMLRASSNSSLMIQAALGGGSTSSLNLDRYVGTFTLDEPAPQGYVQVWVNEPDQRRESVVEYALGGNPAYRHGTGAYRHGTGAYRHGTGAYRHGTGAYRHGTGAPTESPDGQVVIFADGLVFAPGEFFALQAVNTLPSPPAGATRVGQTYRLMRSTNAPGLIGASISFYYAGRDVLPGEEDFLSVTFWDGLKWQKLLTVVDTDHNIAIATIPSAAQGVGIYALMSSIEIPLYGPGWTTFGYPAQGSKPVAQALLSISGYYTTVYGTVITDTADPWKVYDVTAPEWVNDLATLDFGKTYWINVSQAITLQVTGGDAAAPSSVAGLPSPPMTVYGQVLAGSGFTPAPNQAVTAWVSGKQCGQGTTRSINGQVVYTLNILPDASGGSTGCGAAGRSISFKIGARAMSTTIGWDIDRVRSVPLMPWPESNHV